jgi:hypothetical protein
MPHTDIFDDALADCYQAVEHIIECYGLDQAHGTRLYAAGDLLLIRTPRQTVVKFRGREVMRVPQAAGSISVKCDPRGSWMDEIDRIYESIQTSTCP